MGEHKRVESIKGHIIDRWLATVPKSLIKDKHYKRSYKKIINYFLSLFGYIKPPLNEPVSCLTKYACILSRWDGAFSLLDLVMEQRVRFLPRSRSVQLCSILYSVSWLLHYILFLNIQVIELKKFYLFILE